MKLFFDARYIEPRGQSGISRYSIEMATALTQLCEQERRQESSRTTANDSEPVELTFLISNPAQLDALPAHVPWTRIHDPTSLKEFFSAFVLNRYAPDVVFSPMQTIGSLGRRYKLILTLHDLIYYHHRTPPQQLNPWLRLGWRLYHISYIPQRIVLNRADMIATVSQTSKKDILAARLTKRPVIVTRNAPQLLQQFLARPVLAKKTPRNLVYMGSFMEYKNVELLLDGMALLPEYTLHLLSRLGADRQAELKARVPVGAQVIFHNGVSNQEYTELLADRALLVSASLDEGYGLPVVEALALGVPAVISNIPIFHEVGGKGALYFNPLEPADFARQVRRASKLETYQKLAAQARTQGASFSWDDSAALLLKAVRIH